MKADEILRQTAGLVAGDRDRQHGAKRQNHENIATLWQAYLGVQITARDVALMMGLLKVARTKTGCHNPDDYVDACGYLAIAGELADADNPVGICVPPSPEEVVLVNHPLWGRNRSINGEAS